MCCVIYRVAHTSPEEQARLSVLAQWLDTPFYQQLRTEEQLGYIVNAGYSPLLEAPGIALVVQSPDVESGMIAERMDAFMAAAGERLETLTEEALAAHRLSGSFSLDPARHKPTGHGKPLLASHSTGGRAL